MHIVANSGVIVRTYSAEAARKLMDAAPKTLKAVEARHRRPLMALNGLPSDPSKDSLLEDLHKINLGDDPKRTIARARENCKVAVKL